MKTKPESAPATKSKRTPIPVRFSEEETEMLTTMKSATSLPLADIVRRAVRFALPKFQSGEVNPLQIPEPAK